MPADPTPNRPGPGDPEADAGLVDPRTIHPGPDLDTPVVATRDDAPAPPSPSRDTAEDRGGPRLVDPRPDLPTPEDLKPGA